MENISLLFRTFPEILHLQNAHGCSQSHNLIRNLRQQHLFISLMGPKRAIVELESSEPSLESSCLMLRPFLEVEPEPNFFLYIYTFYPFHFLSYQSA